MSTILGYNNPHVKMMVMSVKNPRGSKMKNRMLISDLECVMQWLLPIGEDIRNNNGITELDDILRRLREGEYEE
jgi:hypothetical protein